MAQGGVGGSAPMQQPQQQYQQDYSQQQFNAQPQQQYQQQPDYSQQQFNQQPQPQPQYQPQPQPQYQPQPQPQMQQAPVQPQQRQFGNGVVLKKGQKVALAGAGGGALSNIQVCLGWDVKNQACDLDASAFMLGADGRVIGDDWFVFYGQTTSPDGSVRHSGDSTNGAAMGDDEIIDINLASINPNVKKITFVVTINEALEQGLNFSMVANAYVRVVDKTNGQELNRFQLTDYYANVTAMVVGEVYNHNGQWKFNAVGDGVAKDLAGLCGMYGVNVAD
jgi:tellurium resistance protein TerD